MLSEGLQRKNRTEAILQQAGIPFLPSLPTIETEDETQIRSVEEIAGRIFCLLIVSGIATGMPADVADGLIEDYGVERFLTEREQKFWKAPNQARQDQVNFSWQAEACWPLLWSIGFVPELGLPRETISPNTAIGMIDELGVEGVIEKAKLRPTSEILDAADLIYRLHWATRQASLNGHPAPASLNPGVTTERHQALNWLINYDRSANWDDVTTDT